MEEINVGEFIRIREPYGEIYKVIGREQEDILLVDSLGNNRVETGYVSKHSENIIDLIEVGDILKIEDYGDISYIGWEKDTTALSYKDMIEDIKNGKVKLLGIVTRQQFNSIKYEVE